MCAPPVMSLGSTVHLKAAVEAFKFDLIVSASCDLGVPVVTALWHTHIPPRAHWQTGALPYTAGSTSHCTWVCVCVAVCVCVCVCMHTVVLS